MGEVYFREKEYEVAALNYSRAISSDPDFYWSYYKKAMVCDLLDLKDEAIHNFVLFLEKSTDKNFKQNAYARQRIKTLKKYWQTMKG